MDSSEVFNEKYARWFDILSQHKEYKLEIQFLEGWIHSSGGGKECKILDIGCGTGIHAMGLNKSGWEVMGIDPAPAMIRVAQSKHSPVTFRLGSVEEFSEVGFHFAYAMNHVVNYLPGLAELFFFLKGVYRVLKPEGMFLFEVWNPVALILTPPVPFTRTFETEEFVVTRPVIPEFDSLFQKLRLRYHIQVVNKLNGQREEFSVIHRLHLFTPSEIFYFLDRAGFRKIEIHPAFTEKEPLSDSTRFLSFTCRK